MSVEQESRIRATELGHVSLYVRDVEASVRFYRDVLGLSETGRGKDGRIAFLTAGKHHHDLSLEAARLEGSLPPKGAPGLYHIAFRIGSGRAELAAARRDLERQGFAPFGDAEGTHPCFCVNDPDGHTVELYVEPAG